MKSLVWIRNDLRVEDNLALSSALQTGATEVVFIACVSQWQQHYEADAKIGLKADVLANISQQLADSAIPFHLLECDTFMQCAPLLLQLCQQRQITDIWFYDEIPLDEQLRDQAVTELLAKHHITTHSCGWDLLLPKPLYNKQGLPFKVFTPFYKSWLIQLENMPVSSVAPFNTQSAKQGSSEANVLTTSTPHWKKSYREDLWQKNSIQVQDSLSKFCQHKMNAYAQQRDIPAIAGTSTLSPYLALGMLSPRHMFNTIQLECAAQGKDWRTNDWLRELAWREFYKQLMWHFPQLCQGKPFKADTQTIRWNQAPQLFQAWCQGKTGFPIVDAAMRQLTQTGWMHNRLRMVSASFLTKLLFIDWRQGERFFMQHLIDGDFASNNGGWQWSSSTGCDSVPYFRVFNPQRQSEKFDPNGSFIRRFLPELQSLDAKSIHNPTLQQRKEANYPLPIIDYANAREQAISAFKQHNNSA